MGNNQPATSEFHILAFIPRHHFTANQSSEIIHDLPLPLLYAFSPQCPYRSWQMAICSQYQKAATSGVGHSNDVKHLLQDRKPSKFWEQVHGLRQASGKMIPWWGIQMRQKTLHVLGRTWKRVQEQVQFGSYSLYLSWTSNVFKDLEQVLSWVWGLFIPQTPHGMKMDQVQAMPYWNLTTFLWKVVKFSCQSCFTGSQGFRFCKCR